MNCPVCGSKKVRKIDPPSPLQFTSDRQCKACETVWRLPTPRWAGAISFIFSCVWFCLMPFFSINWVISPGIQAVSSGREFLSTLLFVLYLPVRPFLHNLLGMVIVLGMSVGAMHAYLYGKRVMRGEHGKLVILKQGSNAPPAVAGEPPQADTDVQKSKQSRIADYGLILGILSVLGFGFGTGLPAIICARLARKKTGSESDAGKKLRVLTTRLGVAGSIAYLVIPILAIAVMKLAAVFKR